MGSEASGCYERVRGWLEIGSPVRDRLARALPHGTPVDAWVEAALGQARSTRGIGSPMSRTEAVYADPLTVLGAIFTHATLGLRHEGPLGQAYFQCQPRKEKDRATGDWRVVAVECTAGVGYKGLCCLAYQDPLVREPEAVLIYEGDAFEAIKGTTPQLRHTINLRGQSLRVVGAYAGLRYRDGYYSFQVFPARLLEEHRRSVLAVSGVELEVDTTTGEERFFETWRGKRQPLSDHRVRGTPWAAHGPAMIQKTALRWAAKYWNLGAGFDTAAHLLSLEEAGLSQGLDRTGASVLRQATNAGGDDRDVHAATPGLVAQLVTEATGRPPAEDDSRFTMDPKKFPMERGPCVIVPKRDKANDDTMTQEEIAAALARERAEAQEWEKNTAELLMERDLEK